MIVKTLVLRIKGGPRALPIFTTLFLLLLLLAQSATSSVITWTVTLPPPTPSPEPQYTDTQKFTSAILNGTNVYRRAHNASALAWNASLASFARSYLSRAVTGSSCNFKHSGGPFGENLAIGYNNATESVEAWGSERKKYNYRRPGYSEDTGHFTQLVWKATKTVGCERKLCGAKGWYVACEYWPPGNVEGAYGVEVDRPKNEARTIHRRPGWSGLLPVGIFLWIHLL